MKLFAALNGTLTSNAKTCKRVAVLEAIETDGHAWGCVRKYEDGRLIMDVVNRSQPLAEKYAEGWNRSARLNSDDWRLHVVRVFPTKEQAIEG